MLHSCGLAMDCVGNLSESRIRVLCSGDFTSIYLIVCCPTGLDCSVSTTLPLPRAAIKNVNT